MQFEKGMRVTVSVKDLFESEVNLYGLCVETEEDETGKHGYWDLYNSKGYVVCMDGETCLITDVGYKWIELRNDDGEKPMFFSLSLAAASIACAVCPV